jgi:hypothetical protein
MVEARVFASEAFTTDDEVVSTTFFTLETVLVAADARASALKVVPSDSISTTLLSSFTFAYEGVLLTPNEKITAVASIVAAALRIIRSPII